jgi:hypothetical protein
VHFKKDERAPLREAIAAAIERWVTGMLEPSGARGVCVTACRKQPRTSKIGKAYKSSAGTERSGRRADGTATR